MHDTHKYWKIYGRKCIACRSTAYRSNATIPKNETHAGLQLDSRDGDDKAVVACSGTRYVMHLQVQGGNAKCIQYSLVKALSVYRTNTALMLLRKWRGDLKIRHPSCGIKHIQRDAVTRVVSWIDKEHLPGEKSFIGC